MKIADLNDIVHIDGPYCILSNASNIKEKNIPALASKLLFDDELQVFQQRKSLRAKKEYLASRFLIKTLMSKYLALPYTEIQLRFNSREQKLEAIFNQQPIAVSISLAHSKGMIFFALSDVSKALGVDIEYLNFNRDILSVAEAFFHPDEFKALTKHEYAQFYQLWTLKESLAKATGQSILALLTQDTSELLKKFQHTLGQYDNFQLAAIHSSEINPTPCYLLDLEKLLPNCYE